MLLVSDNVDGNRPTKASRMFSQLLRAVLEAGTNESCAAEPKLQRVHYHMPDVQNGQPERLHHQQSFSYRNAGRSSR